MSGSILGNKVVVIGANGSGKTTFAGKLSRALGIPHVELDSVYWQPDWGELPRDEFRKSVDEITSKDQWIIDGNYARNQDITLLRADTVIWLDYPFLKVIYNVAKRSVTRVVNKKPLWHNNTESFGRMFSKESIILFAIRTYNRKRKRYKKLIQDEEYKNRNWVIIKSRKDEKELMEKINEH